MYVGFFNLKEDRTMKSPSSDLIEAFLQNINIPTLTDSQLSDLFHSQKWRLPKQLTNLSTHLCKLFNLAKKEGYLRSKMQKAQNPLQI